VPALPAPSSVPSSDDHNLEGATASCISSQHLSSNDKSDMDFVPPLVSTARTPQVLWHQDECIIYIKIMLTGVQKYYIGWDVMHLQFRYEHFGKMRFTCETLVEKVQGNKEI
jgi:hypothetical protein